MKRKARHSVIGMALVFGAVAGGAARASNPRFGIGKPGQGDSLLAFNRPGQEWQTLNAGWAHDWGTNAGEGPYPFLDYVHLVGGWGKGNVPSEAEMQGWVNAYPQIYKEGSVWMLGNEIGFDDGRTPRDYAVDYRTFYYRVKNLRKPDGTPANFKAATGGVILGGANHIDESGQLHKLSGTEYLRRVVEAYKREFGTSQMPVDEYCVHGYHLESASGSPRGFAEVVKEFRTYLKSIGEQDKPVFMKEFGNLPDGMNEKTKAAYMRATVGFLATYRDPGIGMPSDGNRLVQRWAWFAFHDGEEQFEGIWDNTNLFDHDGRLRRPLGELYGSLARQYLDLYRNDDGRPDLLVIRKDGTGNSTEVTTLLSENGYGTYPLPNPTVMWGTAAPQFTFLVADYDRDGRMDVWNLAKQGTGTRSTEVHIAGGADNYGSFILHTGTALHETGDNFVFEAGDWNRDGRPDLWAIKKWGTGGGATEVHVLDGASSFSRFVANIRTALHETGASFDFAVADWNRDGWLDLWAIKKSGTGSNRVEAHVLAGPWFNYFLLNSATALWPAGDELTFEVEDYDRDGTTDLYAIKKRLTGSQKTEVHVLSGRDYFRSFLHHAATKLPETPRDYEFVVVR